MSELIHLMGNLQLRQEPYSLPDAFEWSDIDMTVRIYIIIFNIRFEGEDISPWFLFMIPLTSFSYQDEKELQEVYTLLCENYVEDDDNMFRFDYSKQFLQW